MRRVSSNNLVPGMVVATDVYNFNEQLILAKGTVLNDMAITKLAMYPITSVSVEDETVPLPAGETAAAENTYFDKVRSTPEYKAFKADFDKQSNVLRNQLHEIIDKNSLPDVDSMLLGPLSLVRNTKNSANLLGMLQTMRDYDDCTYVHSLNVALLCNIMAQWLKMSPGEIQLATLCGLLHDIGKLTVPEEIIQKPDKYNKQEYMKAKEHAMGGFQLLKDKDIDAHVKNAALMHHERCDGSGYPFHKKADEIDFYAKMVAIADVYDAMTSARVYRGPLCPFTVIDIFEEEGLQCYDTKCILTFLEHIVNSYILTTVQLSDKRQGKIVYINRHRLSRPTVQIGEAFVDLSKEKRLRIEAIL